MSLFDEPEFDPEREATPERKRWSPEWLRADRERHEREEKQEREKKQRARELKQAAKKRGEELEQKQTVEPTEQPEPEIAPKGEKLRKKWRRAILRKSQQLLEFFHRDNPETIDGVRLAEIMVAERIVALNEHLETTEPKTEERRSTKTELDFMGLLAEKLSSPEVEVPREIAEVHRAIVEESHATVVTEVVVDEGSLAELIDTEAPEPRPELRPSEVTPDPQHDAFVRHGGAVLAALRKVLRPREPKMTVTPSGGGDSYSVTVVPTAAASPVVQTQPVPPGAPLAATLVVVEQLRRSETKQPNRPPDPQKRIDPQPSRSVEQPAALPQPVKMRQPEVQPVSHEATTAHHEASLPAVQRLEYMETRDLLELARDVSIGHGQYLKRAYETGQIDRDGLIQVLKAKRRGQDYFTQYRLATRAYREHVRLMRSPERVSTGHENIPPDMSSSPVEQKAPPSAPPETRQPTPAAQAEPTNAERTVDEIINSMREQAARERSVPIAAIVAATGLTIATIIVYLLFFR